MLLILFFFLYIGTLPYLLVVQHFVYTLITRTRSLLFDIRSLLWIHCRTLVVKIIESHAYINLCKLYIKLFAFKHIFDPEEKYWPIIRVHIFSNIAWKTIWYYNNLFSSGRSPVKRFSHRLVHFYTGTRILCVYDTRMFIH